MMWLEVTLVERLQQELRRSMRSLLRDLCRELERDYASAVRRFRLPVRWFVALGRSLDDAAYGHHKVVGWIESLNDLLYFIDLAEQVRRERSRSDIAAQIQAEFKDKFYEHGYADEVFPSGKPEPGRLLSRLVALCRRLAQEVTQESISLAPQDACRWVAAERRSVWTVPCDLNANVERVELPWAYTVGTTGLCYEAKPALRRALQRTHGQAELSITPAGITLVVDGRRFPLLEQGTWVEQHWRPRAPHELRQAGETSLTLGPALIYNRARKPVTVTATKSVMIERIQRALAVIAAAWPEGNRLLALCTTRIAPLKATGVVSFSYRHRPGLSVINGFERDQLDLIDDLIHENSHHHLNLLLRKAALYRNDHNQETFYSPWRRSLRPLRGILHATFTFTMGAILFARLSQWADGRRGRAQWKAAGLTARDLLRARARGLEEIESVRYSLQDLVYAGGRLKWLTTAGRRLVEELAAALQRIERPLRKHQSTVERSAFGPALRRHRAELAEARATFDLTETGG